MQVTIIPSDNFVKINGTGKFVDDLSFMDSDIHAIQYDNGIGQIETRNIDNRKTLNSEEEIPNWGQIQEAFAKSKDPNDEDNTEPTEEGLMAIVRAIRKEKLEKSDIEVLRALESGEIISQELKNYRIDLREIPNKIVSGQIDKPTWDNETGLIFNWPVAP